MERGCTQHSKRAGKRCAGDVPKVRTYRRAIRHIICRRNYIIEEIGVVLDVVVQVWQVGVHFKALVKLESLVPLVLPCIFLTSQTRPPEHCG